MAFVESKEFKWAVLYLIGCSNEPFVKAPIVPDTVLAAQAVIGLSEDERSVNCNGLVAHKLVAQYKVYMLCGSKYFYHVDNIVDIANWFYKYLRTEVDPNMDRETAYFLTTSVFPPTTRDEMGLHAIMTDAEVKAMLKTPAPIGDIPAIRFYAHGEVDEEVVRYVNVMYKSMLYSNVNHELIGGR